MTTGDLPPSSSVTGTRLALAAFITALPTGVLPVKTRWSKGSAENAAPMSGPPVTTATCSSGKISPSILARSALVAGVNSDGLIMARLPAAIAVASGISDSPTGKFHGDMMPTTPSGW